MNPAFAPSRPPIPGKAKRSSRLRTVGQLFGAFRGTGRWWLTPLIAVLLLVAVVLVVVSIAQYAAPFVYTLF